MLGAVVLLLIRVSAACVLQDWYLGWSFDICFLGIVSADFLLEAASMSVGASHVAPGTGAKEAARPRGRLDVELPFISSYFIVSTPRK
jgi:hypothetical protein